MRTSLFTGLFLVLTLAACTENKPAEKKTAAKDSPCATQPLNPNGDSELALLMRRMATWTESTKSYVERGEMPTNLPADFNTISTAKSTDSTLDRVTFNVYANSWLMAYERFKRSDNTDRVQNFNAIVNACAGCHDQFCHGPLKRINKMRIAD